MKVLQKTWHQPTATDCRNILCGVSTAIIFWLSCLWYSWAAWVWAQGQLRSKSCARRICHEWETLASGPVFWSPAPGKRIANCTGITAPCDNMMSKTNNMAYLISNKFSDFQKTSSRLSSTFMHPALLAAVSQTEGPFLLAAASQIGLDISAQRRGPLAKWCCQGGT